MVGACADWFAVTAIFRHPFGLPIPHTALIPRKKEMIGRSLEEFVGENFMREDIIRERVLDAEPTRRAAEWVLAPGHAKRLVDEVATVTCTRCTASPTRTCGRSSSRRCCHG